MPSISFLQVKTNLGWLPWRTGNYTLTDAQATLGFRSTLEKRYRQLYDEKQNYNISSYMMSLRHKY